MKMPAFPPRGAGLDFFAVWGMLYSRRISVMRYSGLWRCADLRGVGIDPGRKRALKRAAGNGGSAADRGRSHQ